MKILTLIFCCLLTLNAVAQIKPLKTDPTKPKVGNATAKHANVSGAPVIWQLQAINISAMGRNAVINGQVFSEGQKISASTTIEKIDFGQVKLRSQGKTRILSLNNAEIKKESNAY